MSIPVQEKRFEYKGYPCVVLFQPIGFRTGYVGLPKKSKYYKKDYDFIPVDCHCGLTYSKDSLYNQYDEDVWWIGFDCGHACDGYDVEKVEKYFKYDNQVMELANTLKSYWSKMNELYPIRTLEYCEEQCQCIVDQILQLED